MINNLIAVLSVDGYKTSHIFMDAPGTTEKYYTWTPRSNKYLPEVDKVVVFNIQGFIKKWVIKFWNENFFSLDKEFVVSEYKKYIKPYLFAEDVYIQHIEELHDLGYLPLEICAMEEGTLCDIRNPCLTFRNTNPKFAWVAGYLENIISTCLWQPMTVASIARKYKQIFTKYAIETTGSSDFVQFQGHDFSYRGLMSGIDAIQESGAAHLTSFVGTDLIPAIPYLVEYYNADLNNEIVGCSVPASEHSVACTYGPDEEEEYVRHLIQDVYPKGFVSIVSDTWDLWNLVTVILPKYKDIIMNRDGRVVIRPDSGNPADILCGSLRWTNEFVNFDNWKSSEAEDNRTVEEKGLIELLWDIFGGTKTEQGFKVLDSHIGAIYGDSITLELAEEICERLKAKGFASINWVAGIGSWSYLGKLSRDSMGYALKETAIVKNGVDKPVWKDPVTDDGTKKSARGRVVVVQDGDKQVLIDGLTKEDLGKYESANLLKPVFKDGVLLRETNLTEIRANLTK